MTDWSDSKDRFSKADKYARITKEEWEELRDRDIERDRDIDSNHY
jgi:hypothetical protein